MRMSADGRAVWWRGGHSRSLQGAAGIKKKDDIGIDGTSEKLSNIIVAHAALGTDGASPGDLSTNNFIMYFQFETGFQNWQRANTKPSKML